MASLRIEYEPTADKLHKSSNASSLNDSSVLGRVTPLEIYGRKDNKTPQIGNLQGKTLDDTVRKASLGDGQATDTLLRELHPVITRYCISQFGQITVGHLSTEDVIQEVELAVVNALPQFAERELPPIQYIFGIVEHKIADMRQGMKESLISDREIPDKPTNDLEPEEEILMIDMLASMLAILTPKQKEVLNLRIIRGLSVQQTALVSNSTAGGVRILQHRALKRLRRYISNNRDMFEDLFGDDTTPSTPKQMDRSSSEEKEIFHSP